MPNTNKPIIATIMVNYRAGDLILENLISLVEHHRALSPQIDLDDHQAPLDNNHIYIVDNDSQNGDAETLQNFVDAQNLNQEVTIIAHPFNGGFGAGNNVGIKRVLAKQAVPDMIMFLNPDAHLAKDSLKKLISFMHQNPKAGFAGCQINDLDGHAQSSAFRFFSPASEFESTVRTGPFSKILKNYIVPLQPTQKPIQCDWVSGAAFMMRTVALKEIGLFDEEYFLYFEETDMMKRGKGLGWDTWHVPEAHAVHQEGYSTGNQGGVATQKPLPDYWYHSRNHYFAKHHTLFVRLIADIAWLKGSTLYALRCAITRTPSKIQWIQIKNFIRLWGKNH